MTYNVSSGTLSLYTTTTADAVITSSVLLSVCSSQFPFFLVAPTLAFYRIFQSFLLDIGQLMCLANCCGTFAC